MLNFYRHLVKYMLIVMFLVCCKAQYNEHSTLDSAKLVGVWSYVETRNHLGDKIESIEHKHVSEIEASGPEIYLKADGSFTQIFQKKYRHKGNWNFNNETMTIEYDLYIDSTDWIGKDLIKSGLAIKQSDGLYYERIEDRILEFGEGLMVIDLRGNQQVYKKRD